MTKAKAFIADVLFRATILLVVAVAVAGVSWWSKTHVRPVAHSVADNPLCYFLPGTDGYLRELERVSPAAARNAVLPDGFSWNDEHDPNRCQPGHVQTEDGSWVPASFYTGGESARNAGECAEFSNGHVVCAPAYSPDGGTIERLFEDGSVRYTDDWTLGGWDDAPRTFTKDARVSSVNDV